MKVNSACAAEAVCRPTHNCSGGEHLRIQPAGLLATRLWVSRFFVAGIAVAAATFVKFWDQPLTTENLWSVIVRLLYAIAITAPAWYTARESARHRTNADRARQTELELASIGPFIELLPEEKKTEIKEALTKSYFGRPVDPHQVQTPLDALQVKDLVIELVKVLKK